MITKLKIKIINLEKKSYKNDGFEYFYHNFYGQNKSKIK